MTPETTEYCNQIANGNNDLGGPKVDDSTPITYVMYNEKQHPRVHGCYTYNVGDIHFVVISSNHKDVTAYDYYKSQGIAKPSKEDFYNDQFEWLREDLDDPETKKKRWCIFMTHASPISCTRMLPKQPMLSFIQEYHPHFVFCGHNHTYARSLPLDNVPLPTIKKGEFINANTGADSSIPPEITDPRSYYTHWDSGTVYVMCQSTGCKLVGKYGQVRNAWWYDWHGQHPYAPTYIKVNITRDKVSFRAYKINEIVPTENDLQLFYTTPPIPVGPARYKGNPIYGGTNPDPTPVNVECIDYADDEYNASDAQELVRLKDVGARGSYSWRPWGKDLTNGIDS